eukprot:5918467-Amphidinium_carterae.1
MNLTRPFEVTILAIGKTVKTPPGTSVADMLHAIDAFSAYSPLSATSLVRVCTMRESSCQRALGAYSP